LRASERYLGTNRVLLVANLRCCEIVPFVFFAMQSSQCRLFRNMMKLNAMSHLNEIVSRETILSA